MLVVFVASLEGINYCMYKLYIYLSNTVNSKSLFLIAPFLSSYFNIIFPFYTLDPLLVSCSYVILFISLAVPSLNNSLIANQTAEPSRMKPGIIVALFAKIRDSPFKFGTLNLQAVDTLQQAIYLSRLSSNNFADHFIIHIMNVHCVWSSLPYP